MAVLLAASRLNDLAARVRRRDLPFARAGVKIADLMSPLDHRKAEQELGWVPRPVEESIAVAARFFRDQQA